MRRHQSAFPVKLVHAKEMVEAHDRWLWGWAGSRWVTLVRHFYVMHEDVA